MIILFKLAVLQFATRCMRCKKKVTASTDYEYPILCSACEAKLEEEIEEIEKGFDDEEEEIN